MTPCDTPQSTDREGSIERSDDVATLRIDSTGQGTVEVAGRTVHAYWACAVCGIATGSPTRQCPHHPEAVLFLRRVREEAIGG